MNTGPSICRECGRWPAYRDNRLCHICDCIDWCNAHPVPGGPTYFYSFPLRVSHPVINWLVVPCAAVTEPA